MKLRHIYLVFCLLGTALPMVPFVPWLAIHGFDPRLFLSELFSTRIGAFFGMDVIVSALVLCVFIAVERGRLAMKNLWAPVVATFAVGVSLGLPLFLYLRQIAIEGQSGVD